MKNILNLDDQILVKFSSYSYFNICYDYRKLIMDILFTLFKTMKIFWTLIDSKSFKSCQLQVDLKSPDVFGLISKSLFEDFEEKDLEI